MKLLVIGDPHGKLLKRIPKKVDLILCTGDFGKADLARKHSFENSDRKKKGLIEKDYTKGETKKAYMEIYNSTFKILNKLIKIAPVYSILGNVATQTDAEMKKEEKELKIKLPFMRKGLNKLKNFHLVRNRVRRINGLRIGFLEFFTDNSWIKEFKEKGKESIREAKKETAKAKQILNGFAKLDILVCHQPPYGILDKVSGKEGAPKEWRGKHAGSKVILDYIKKHKPKYVFCGHIHEGKGKKKIGKTIVYNTGCCGDYVLLDIK